MCQLTPHIQYNANAHIGNKLWPHFLWHQQPWWGDGWLKTSTPHSLLALPPWLKLSYALSWQNPSSLTYKHNPPLPPPKILLPPALRGWMLSLSHSNFLEKSSDTITLLCKIPKYMATIFAHFPLENIEIQNKQRRQISYSHILTSKMHEGHRLERPIGARCIQNHPSGGSSTCQHQWAEAGDRGEEGSPG